MAIAFYTMAEDKPEDNYSTLTSALARNTIEAPASSPALHMPRYGGGGGGGAYFFMGMELGYSAGKYTLHDTAAKGGGFMYTLELGVKISMPGNNPGKTGVLSISGSFTRATMSKFKLGFISVPISYTRMGLGRDGNGTGFYWQAGVNVRYVSDASANNRDVKAGLNTIVADPFVSLGISTPFRLVNRRSGDEVGGGRVQIGPSFSYSAMNLVKTGDLHGIMIGLRYQYMFM